MPDRLTRLSDKSDRRLITPWAVGAHLAFDGVDLLRLGHGQAKIVETVHQAVLADMVDLEGDAATFKALDHLVFQVDGQRDIGTASESMRQCFQLAFADLHPQPGF